MGLRDWVRRLFADIPPSRARTMLETVRTYGDAPVRGTSDFLGVYETHPWVRAIGGRVAEHIGQTEWILTRSDRAEAEVPRDHLAYRVLRDGNAMMPGRDLWLLAQLSLDLVGDAFLLRERNGLGATTALWPIPAHWIDELPIPGRPTFRVAWQSWQGEIPESEMLWLKVPRPADPYSRGTGIVRAQADELETDEYAAKHAKNLFWNRAMPDIVVMDPAAGVEEMDRHEHHWNSRLQGFWRAFKPYFTNRELKFWQPAQMNMENLTLVPIRKHERDVIMQTWGVPPEQFGLIENSNRATIEASDDVMERRVIEPRRIALAAQLQTKLIRDYDPRLRLGFRSTVPADKEHQHKVRTVAPWAFTGDEYRAAAGLPPLPGGAGKVFVVPMNSYVTSDLTDEGQRPAAAGPKPPATEGPAEELPN